MDVTYKETVGTGWRFRAIFPDGSQVVTNEEGEGLFRITSHGEVHQGTGTGSFHAASLEDFERKMRARFRGKGLRQ